MWRVTENMHIPASSRCILCLLKGFIYSYTGMQTATIPDANKLQEQMKCSKDHAANILLWQL